MKLAFFILLFVLAMFLFVCTDNHNRKEIKEWATEQGMTVSNIEQKHTSIGSPFYYIGKGQRLYKVSMTNGEIWWVRCCTFSNDYEKDRQ